MDSGKGKRLMVLGIHLLWLFSVYVPGYAAPNGGDVIDLLAALNTSRHISGVARIQSAGNMIYKLGPRAPYLTLPPEYSQLLLSNLHGGMGVYFVGHQSSGSSATLFSVSSPSSPILQIISSTLDNTLRLDYHAGEGARGLVSFQFPLRNPFSRDDWVKLAVSLEPDRLVFFVDCQEAVVVPMKGKERLNLELPQNILITLGSTPRRKATKFNGQLKTAEVSMKSYPRHPWHCDSITDALPPSQNTNTQSSGSWTDSSQTFQQGASPSKPQTRHTQVGKKNSHSPDIQSDQLQRGLILGHPRSPQVITSFSRVQRDERLKYLEKRVAELTQMLNMCKAQNVELQSRLKYQEGCDCVRLRCEWEGREVDDGQRWQTDVNTVCICKSGKVTCQPNTGDPCMSSPCQNGGVCIVLTSDPRGFDCSCPPDTKGPVCHRQLRQACLVPKPENNCEGVRPLQRRWAFNPTSGLCEDFLHCPGNSSNNFPSFNACREQCMFGACCLRKPRQGRPMTQQRYTQHGHSMCSEDRTASGYELPNLEHDTSYSNIDFNYTEPEDLSGNHKRINCCNHLSFTYTCDYVTLKQCQALVKNQAGETQAVSFAPGVKCSVMRSGGGCGCLSQHELWNFGERVSQGREVCTYTGRGRDNCACGHLIQRKEIRDLTLREMRVYQRAIRKLYARSGCELDGLVHNVSYDVDGDCCQICTSKGCNRESSPMPCPSLDCAERETVPGSCCQQCKSCTHFGVQYEHKVAWRPEENPCDVCHCLEGLVQCKREPCHTPCNNPASPPPGSCCPVCQGCGVNGRDFPNGNVIPTGDRCQECTCVNGDVVCAPPRCPDLSCRNSVSHAGDCCPRCEHCEYESQVYTEGQTFLSRRDPCLHCRCSAGEVSCERADVSCPTPRCKHPARREGECCPTCDACEYDRRTYTDGKVFNPAGSGPCLQCRCKSGNVICHEEKCPPIQCATPIIDPHRCCPICKTCVSEGVEYKEGSTWHPGDPCTSCTCVNGETLCSQASCLPTDCQHPTKTAGSCCAMCETCTYNHRIYDNGQRFTDPDQPCQICTCRHGTVNCERRPCPPLNCSNSYTPSRGCCPRCQDCSYENRIFVNGDAFLNPVNVCEECTCVSGRIDCHRAQCPQPHCSAPRPGTCCQNNCNGCSYAGKEYGNGLEFPHPTDPCRTCSCTNGNVQCLMRRCPPLPCSNPSVELRDCCPRCPVPPSDCTYEQQLYKHAERFYDPTDNCRLCACTDGTVQCQRKTCPFAACSHPITQECCQTCEGCLYEGRELANGETWNDASDPCAVCVCQEGSVRCEKRHCPPARCTHPVRRQCCLSCDNCLFNGKEYADGTEISDEKDPCNVCHCYGGEVSCSLRACHDGCSHPYKPPGQCCGECERCFYNGLLFANGQSIPDAGNPCSFCTCQRGSMHCVSHQCGPAPCPHPVTDACGCPVCDGCHFRGETFADGQSVPRGEGGCEECTCSKGEVVCSERGCPPAPCPHPDQDSCSCGVCDGCNFNGRNCYNGERFPHPKNPCQICSCVEGSVECISASCPSVSCEHPATPQGECCPMCTGICVHQGIEYQPGSTFTSPSDPCSTCTCLNEVVNCQKSSCPVQCLNPVPSGACCPVCDSCLYEGVVYSHSQTFTPSSNPCYQCTCIRGTVTCAAAVCPQINCERPITRPGQCCPECPVCVLEGQELREAKTVTLSSDHCSTCTCQAGELHCTSPDCPKVSCMHQVTDPGACCPRCRGCMYGGEEHPEGSSWFADSSPCMSCMCLDGVTTCSEVHCLSPCTNFISVPGECCPICADCVFEGRVYGPGDSFHPANDPCQICICEVMADGVQHLKCYRKQCPSLVDCPKSKILFSRPDSCCPVCAQPLSNCTSALIGNEVLATDDPCFTCHCKDLTWTCLHKQCLPLSCPSNEQFIPPDSCCPACNECVIEGETRVGNGSNWTDSDDNCVTCSCNSGHIECSIEECLHTVCPNGQKLVKLPGKCCSECQDSRVSCLHQGTVYHSNQQWEVDECTTCICVSGDVHCRTERCPPLTCATDEMPAVVPGVCCPHCLPRPATCIAFGDPHYRTFDGRMLHFQGACTYILAQDCENGDFSIHATNDDRGRKGVSWTKEVTVFIGDVTVQLLQDRAVKVNDEVVTLPFLIEPFIFIERQSNTILINTNIGLKVLWSGRSHLEVSVPGSYKGHTCGLCGNFNNYHQDDLRMPSGQLSQSESDFGNSWRVTNGSHSLSSCRPGEDVNPCKDAGYQAKKRANARCKVLKSAVFKPCRRVVPPEPWYGACVYDLCACGANSDECLCDVLEAYASQCREAGVILQWRSPSLCAVGCPVERGFVFDECGPPCPVTCFNVDVPLGVIESHCFKPCVPGCQCPAGLVLHNNYCIQPENCPKIIHGNHT